MLKWLHLWVLLVLGFGTAAWAYQGDCYIIEGVEYCYGDDDDGGNGPRENRGGGGSGEPWSGLSDGRLNPDPGEYYSVWCANDYLDIRRVVPQPETIKLVALVDIIRLEEGGSLDLGDFMTMVRNTLDTITIYGSNGNGAPEPGQKAFSLSECIARNGSAPNDEDEPLDEMESPGGNDEESGPESCFRLFASLEDIVDCLNAQPNLSSLEVLYLRIFSLCIPVPAAVVLIPGGLVLWQRRRRKH